MMFFLRPRNDLTWKGQAIILQSILSEKHLYVDLLRQKTYRAFLVENDNLHLSILKLQQLNLHETRYWRGCSKRKIVYIQIISADLWSFCA